MNERINQMKQALRDLVEGIISSGVALSDQVKVMIARAMEHVANRIQEIRAEEKTNEPPPIEEIEREESIIAEEQQSGEPPPPTEPVPELDQAPHESSNINAFKYDPKSQKLWVKFQGKYPAQNGPVYSYEGVPNNIYEVFRRGAVAPKTSGSNQWHTWKEGVTPSHGAAMYALIREGNYPYQRLS